MVVSAGVMIREHFYKRLRLYVNIAFGGTTTQDMTKQQKKERKERISSIMKACFSTDTTVDPGAQQMRTMLTPEDCAWGEQFFPYSNRIKENGLGFYVRLLYKFQQKVEEHMKELPNEKGVRSFSLLPVSRSYLGGHITINASTLSGFYSRIKRIEQYEWTGVSLSAPSFVLLPVEDKYRHASRLFANQVTTDGYSTSILFLRPKTEEELLMESRKYSKENIERPVVPPGRRSGIKGHAPSSVKGLRKALTKRAMVVSMDEYRTSMLCSQCHHTLSSVCYSVDTRLPTRKKRQGVVLVRNRAEVEFEKKKCHAVLRCDHKDCEARYWDRDVNAAINMLALLKSEVLGQSHHNSPSTTRVPKYPSTTMSAANKTVLITGATRGIGLTFAEYYVNAGWKVIGTARNLDKADKLKALAPFKIVQLETNDEGSIQRMTEKLDGVPIDVLINNAGILEEGEYETVTKDYYRASKSALNMSNSSLAVNLKSDNIIAIVLQPGYVTMELNNGNGVVEPVESVAGMTKVIASVTTDDTAKFFDFLGPELPW
ncbi:hypothetical protein BBJ28_00011469 [Nothophytophthora sp. Chile5]|nr:hypothetical protein BBJ28_00011469 [Nothophytophthora sp. Chile5]